MIVIDADIFEDSIEKSACFVYNKHAIDRKFCT